MHCENYSTFNLETMLDLRMRDSHHYLTTFFAVFAFPLST